MECVIMMKNIIRRTEPAEKRLINTETQLRKHWHEAGDWLVLTSNLLVHDKIVDTIQLRQVE